MNHLLLSVHLGPMNIMKQLHLKLPLTVLIQVPPFWQGFGEHTSKYKKYYLNISHAPENNVCNSGMIVTE